MAICVFCAGVIALSAVTVEAKASPRLSAKSVMIAKGGRQTIRLSSGKGKWTIKSNGVAKLSKVTKKSVKVVPLKAGTTTVTCKVGGKTLRCKVKVLTSKVGEPGRDLDNAIVVGGKQKTKYSLIKGARITGMVYDKKLAKVTKTGKTDPDTGVTKGTITIKGKRPGKFVLKVTVTAPDGKETQTISCIIINGFRGKTAAGKTENNYAKWRKKTLKALASNDTTTWEVIDAIGKLISTGKYSLKGGASGLQLWYGGNGTCVSGAKMMDDFMQDMGIKSKVHFAGNSPSQVDIFGYTVMYAEQHKNTWFKLGGKKWEVNPQPEFPWPIGTVKR